MKILIAAFLFVHAIAHLVGFVVPWKLAVLPDAPYKTTLFNDRLDLGHTGIRIVGLLWLLGFLAFAVVAVLFLLEHGLWMKLAVGTAVYSLLLSVSALPEAKVGIPVNIAILAGLTARYMGWF